jgi:5-methylthioadenosine/S-adenosylhomocysteine deaminase
MDMFAEMRLGALMQKPRLTPDVLDAGAYLDMATVTGAKVLRTNGGDLLPGHAADVVALDPALAHSWGGGHPAGSVVYACSPSNVRHVWIGGDRVVQNGQLKGWDFAETVRGCTAALKRVTERAGL